MNYKEVQQVAKDTISYLEVEIKQGMTVKHIIKLAEEYMLNSGISSFWYYGIGAFVFAGEDTILSISGRNYIPSNRTIKQNDIITIDLSPQFNNIWGDYSRTIIVENGLVTADKNYIENEVFRDGLRFEDILHCKLFDIATPNMTFEELYFRMNDQINQLGCVNLDFLGNLGHSIEIDRDNRIYIEKGNKGRLSDVTMFTFEPHISKGNSKYGFKKENIYYFSKGVLTEL